MRHVTCLAVCLALGCVDPDCNTTCDAGSSGVDAGRVDAGVFDAGSTITDAGTADAGPSDAGTADAGLADAGRPSLLALSRAATDDLLRWGWVGPADAGHLVPTFDGFTDEVFMTVELHSNQSLTYGLTTLAVTDAGNVLLNRGPRGAQTTVWSAFSDAGPGCAPGGCLLTLQPHGNLVLYTTPTAASAANAAWFLNDTLVAGADAQHPSGNTVQLSAFAPFFSIRYRDGGTGWAPPLAVGVPFYERRGAPWERFQAAAVLRSRWLQAHDPEALARFKSDWVHFKSTFVVGHDAGALTSCGFEPTTFANWALDDTGCSALYLEWAHELTQDPDALSLAKSVIQCGFERFLDVDAGGLYYSDAHAAKSGILSWLALAAVKASQAAPTAPDSAQLMSWGRGAYDWFVGYRFQQERFRYDWAAADGGARSIFLTDVSTDPASNFGHISGFPGRLVGGVPTPVEGTDAFSGSGEYYFGALIALNVLQVRLADATGNAQYLDDAKRLAAGIVDTYRTPDGRFIHDRDAWADAYVLNDWFSEVLTRPGMPLEQARLQARAAAVHMSQFNRTPDGHYGPTWSGPPTIHWPSGAAAEQFHTSATAIHMVVVGGAQP